MGELVREVLEVLTREGHLFDGDYDAIERKGCFPTKYVSEIEAEMLVVDENQYTKTQQILEEIGIVDASPIDCANVAYVCTSVSNRAAFICAAGIATLLKRMQKPFVTVGVDGSVYRFHPTFPALLDIKIEELLEGTNLKVGYCLSWLKLLCFQYKLMLSEDGSGRGASYVAAVATRMAKERMEKAKNSC
jgi:hexokinase